MLTIDAIDYQFGDLCGWLRVFGWGVAWDDIRVRDRIYPAARRYNAGLRIGHWALTFLRRDDHYLVTRKIRRLARGERK